MTCINIIKRPLSIRRIQMNEAGQLRLGKAGFSDEHNGKAGFCISFCSLEYIVDSLTLGNQMSKVTVSGIRNPAPFYHFIQFPDCGSG